MIDAVVRVVGLLLPGQLNAFSAARYDRTHHIAPHDDRAYTPVQLDTGTHCPALCVLCTPASTHEEGAQGARQLGAASRPGKHACTLYCGGTMQCSDWLCSTTAGEVITCSREIGVIWYLTQDWREEVRPAYSVEPPGQGIGQSPGVLGSRDPGCHGWLLVAC